MTREMEKSPFILENTPSVPVQMKTTVRTASFALARELKVVGLMNVQFAEQNGQLYVLEVNPRASRTVPFLAKAMGLPLAQQATLTSSTS